MKTKYLILLLAVITLLSARSLAQPQDTNWVKNNTWYFDNFKDPELPWSIFKETFTGVAPEPSGDFDQVLYDQLYKTKLASKGHCFGMCVMALLMKKNGGYLGFCYPPYKYSGTIYHGGKEDSIGPADLNLKTAIAMVHGNQINHGFLLFLLDVISINKNRDGNYAYQQVNYYLAKDDPPVISITKSLSPADGGHVLIPYLTNTIGGKKRIYVYDPNYSFYEKGSEKGHEFYTSGSNYIEISADGSWDYIKGYPRDASDPENWSGGPNHGGNCIVIPLSVAGKKGRLPQSLFADVAEALNKIFIFGDKKEE